MFTAELKYEIKEVRDKISTLYRQNAIVLSDFDRLMLTWGKEFRRTNGAFDFLKLLSALDFSAIKHIAQVRNHADWVPYLIHPLRVALLLFTEGGIVQEDLLVTALLHDTLEDTATTADEVADQFGMRVRVWVEELTELPGHCLVDQVQKISQEAKTVKLADRTHNLRDLLDHPPKIWRGDKVSGFMQRSRELLQALHGAHPTLEMKYIEALRALEIANNI